MTTRKKDPLRTLTKEEENWLERISRSYSEPASHVVRAKEILTVAGGGSYTEAAKKAGRKSGDAVSQLTTRFNREGIAAIQGHPGGKPKTKYNAAERERILAEARRQPDAEKDGTNVWSLTDIAEGTSQSTGRITQNQYRTDLSYFAGSGLPLAKIMQLVRNGTSGAETKTRGRDRG